MEAQMKVSSAKQNPLNFYPMFEYRYKRYKKIKIK